MKAASKYVDVPVSIKNSTYCTFTDISPFFSNPFYAKLTFSLYVPLLQKPGMDVADGYVTFVRHSQDILRDKVNEEVYIERLFDVSKMP